VRQRAQVQALLRKEAMMPEHNWTEKQGQYLAFIYNYTVIHGEPPAEADMQCFFGVTPPSVHQMVLKLEEKGFISRVPRQARTIQMLVEPDQLPVLRDRRREMAKKSTSRASIYQIKVTLEHSKPPIWRLLLVPSDVTLEHLHYIIQGAMGWTNSHLHQFIVGQTYFGEPHPDYGLEMQDERRVRLNQVAPREGFKFRYEYDFGDSWLHDLLVEEILEPEPGQQYPVCIAGKRACPPEDVGGVWGYEEFLQAIGDPDHPEHEEYLEWIGGEFDPEEFDLEETSKTLQELR
jgi:hypothetical protein